MGLLRETGLELLAVIDDGRAGESFFGVPVVSPAEGVAMSDSVVVISSLKRRDELKQLLHDLGVADGRIFVAGVAE